MRQQRGQSLRLVLILLLMISLLAAVAGSPSPALAQDGVVILKDSFKDNSNNWRLTQGNSGTISIANGALTIQTLKAGQTQWTFPQVSVPSDVDASVTVKAVNPQINGDWFYGLGVRGRTAGNSNDFYYLDVNGFGHWDFGLYQKDTRRAIAGGDLKNFQADAEITLRIVAVGSHFDFYINGINVWSADDIKLSTVASNQIVLMGGTNQKVTVQVVKFSDLIIVAPQASATPTAEAVTSTTATPEATAAATSETVVPTPATLPFSENFADTGNPNHWGLARDEIGAVDIAGGALMVDTKQPSQLQWTYPALTFPADVDVTVTAQAVKPDRNAGWDYALGVRGRDVDQSSGLYYLDVMGDGGWQFIVHPKAQTTTVLADGKIEGFKADAATTLRIVAVGSHFDLYVNGAQVGAADDSTLPALDANQVMLLAGTTDKTPSQLVKFTDLKVVAPAASGGSPKATPTAAASTTSALPFSENFADSTNPNGWNLTTTGKDSITLADGALTINATQNSDFLWSYPSLVFPSDVDVTVTAQADKPDMAKSWYFGIGVRGRPDGNSNSFYYFDVIGNGNWEFGLWVKDTPFSAKDGHTNAFKVDAPNTLRFIAVKSHFEFYVNDTKVGTAENNTLGSVEANQIMVLGGTYTKTYAQIFKFTSLSVVAP